MFVGVFHTDEFDPKKDILVAKTKADLKKKIIARTSEYVLQDDDTKEAKSFKVTEEQDHFTVSYKVGAQTYSDIVFAFEKVNPKGDQLVAVFPPLWYEGFGHILQVDLSVEFEDYLGLIMEVNPDAVYLTSGENNTWVAEVNVKNFQCTRNFFVYRLEDLNQMI